MNTFGEKLLTKEIIEELVVEDKSKNNKAKDGLVESVITMDLKQLDAAVKAEDQSGPNSYDATKDDKGEEQKRREEDDPLDLEGVILEQEPSTPAKGRDRSKEALDEENPSPHPKTPNSGEKRSPSRIPEA